MVSVIKSAGRSANNIERMLPVDITSNKFKILPIDIAVVKIEIIRNNMLEHALLNNEVYFS